MSGQDYHWSGQGIGLPVILTGYVNNRPEKKNHTTITFRENKYLFFTSCFCLLVKLVVTELKFSWPVITLRNSPKFILSSGFTLF